MVGRLLLTDMPKRNDLVGACPQGRYYGEAEAGASHVRRIQLMPDFIEIAENSCGASSDQFWTEMRRFESSRPSHTVVRRCSCSSVFVRQLFEIAPEIFLHHSQNIRRRPFAAGKIDGIYGGIWTGTVRKIDAEIPSCV